MPDLHLAWALPRLAREARRAAMQDDQPRLATLARAGEDGLSLLRQWLETCSGTCQGASGEGGRATIPVGRLGELQAILDRVQDVSGPVACGVGRSAREAELALEVAAKRGQGTLVWTEALKDEADKLGKSETETLTKAVAGIRHAGTYAQDDVPAPQDHDVYDYTHHLPEHAQGMRLLVHHHRRGEVGDDFGTAPHLTALLYAGDKLPGEQHRTILGRVDGYARKAGAGVQVEPHSSLAGNVRGKGLGRAMYEALYGHAVNHLGQVRASGGYHSPDASKVHSSLARKHGYEYRPMPSLDPEEVGPYEYAVKDEMSAHVEKAEGGAAAEPQASGASDPRQDSMYQLLAQPDQVQGADFEEQLHQLAQVQAQQDADQEGGRLQRRQQVKRQVGQLLQALKQQAPQLEELRQSAPQVYETVMGLTQGVAALARELVGQGLGKSELSLAKMAYDDPEAPSGLIDPDGDFHECDSYGHDDLLMSTSGISSYEDAYQKGWISVGHAGRPEVAGMESVVRDPNHPATKTLRQLVGGRAWKAAHVAVTAYKDVQGTYPTLSKYHARRFSGGAYVPYDIHLHGLRKSGPRDSEPLDKRLADIPAGPAKKTGVYDYSHVLKPAQRAAGYSLEVHHFTPTVSVPKPPKQGFLDKLLGRKPAPQPAPSPSNQAKLQPLHAKLLHNGNEVGSLDMLHRGSDVQVMESKIAPSHRGKGLGSALYDAGLAHARNVAGAKYAAGGKHSSMASCAHTSLARRHGLEYRPEANPVAEPKGAYDDAYLPYSYALKAEWDAVKALEKGFHHLPLPHAPQRTVLHLPPGTIDPATGKFKTLEATGKTKWKQGRVGVIRSRKPATAAGGFGGPTSSRTPEG